MKTKYKRLSAAFVAFALLFGSAVVIPGRASAIADIYTAGTFEELFGIFDGLDNGEEDTVVVTLTNDMTQLPNDSYTLYVEGGDDVTLDLAGHTLTLRNDQARGIQNYGTLTVTGDGIMTNYDADVEINYSFGLIDNRGGTIIIENGIFYDYGWGAGSTIKNRSGNITIESGLFHAYGTTAGNATIYSDGVLNIHDGVTLMNEATDAKNPTYPGWGTGCYALVINSGKATIGTTAGNIDNPVQIIGNRGALGLNGGDVTINNGVFRSLTYYGAWVTNDDPSEPTMLDIKYGDFWGERYGLYAAVDDGSQDENNVYVEIEDGNFYGNTHAAAAMNDGGSEMEWAMAITGGSYSTDPSEYVVDGCRVYAEEDGFVVEPQGTLAVEDKKVYVDIKEGPKDLTFEEIGVASTGRDTTFESERGGVSVDFEEQTITVWANDTVTWLLNGEAKGQTTFETYYVYNSEEYYGVRVGNERVFYLGGVSENMTMVVADETIAKIERTEQQSGEIFYEETSLVGLKEGETTLEYRLTDGTVVKSVPINVYSIYTTLKQAQAVGTSQTFTMVPSQGYTISELIASTMSYSEEDGAVTFSENSDGSYTVTVNSMPTFTEKDCDFETGECVDGRTENVPFVWVDVELLDNKGNIYGEVYRIVVFDLDTADKASEAVDGDGEMADDNKEIMRGYVASVVEEFDAHRSEVEDNRLELTLDNGTRVVIEDVSGLESALDDGDKIEAVLTEPKDKTEEEVGMMTANEMKNTMGEDKTGHRFVDINVELRAGDKTVGRITDLEKPLMINVDVSGDENVEDGFTREYSAVRYHNGVAQKMSGVTFDAESLVVAFPSDGFSYYLIAYTDTKNEEPEEPAEEPEEPVEEPEEPEEPVEEPEEPEEPAEEPEEPEEPEESAEETKEDDVKTADTGVFTSEGSSAMNTDFMAYIGIVSIFIAVYGACKFSKKNN